jgi:hypothetical protein
VIQVISGTTLWVSKPARYLADGMFQFKLFFVIAAMVVTIFFHQILNRETPVWQSTGMTAVKGNMRVWVGVTALLWAAVLVAGRLTAYLGQLYHA